MENFMSFDTWIKEFYPIDAADYTNKTDEECLKHSIQKWKGALPENCEKHDVRYRQHALFGVVTGENLHFDGRNCALCKKYSDIAPDDDCDCYSDETDEYCPIVRIHSVTCNDTYIGSFNNPTDMIKLLENTLTSIDPQK
jgi:hypothetical protein